MADLQQPAAEAMDWRTRAACLRADPELFFPEYTADPVIERAKQICDGCPVRARCLDWALSHGAAFGIWGGRTEAERRAMRSAFVLPVRLASARCPPRDAKPPA